LRGGKINPRGKGRKKKHHLLKEKRERELTFQEGNGLKSSKGGGDRPESLPSVARRKRRRRMSGKGESGISPHEKGKKRKK